MRRKYRSPPSPKPAQFSKRNENVPKQVLSARRWMPSLHTHTHTHTRTHTHTNTHTGAGHTLPHTHIQTHNHTNREAMSKMYSVTL